MAIFSKITELFNTLNIDDLNFVKKASIPIILLEKYFAFYLLFGSFFNLFTIIVAPKFALFSVPFCTFLGWALFKYTDHKRDALNYFYKDKFDLIDSNIIYKFFYELEITISNVEGVEDKIDLFSLTERLKDNYAHKNYKDFFINLSNIQESYLYVDDNANVETASHFYDEYAKFKHTCENSKEINDSQKSTPNFKHHV